MQEREAGKRLGKQGEARAAAYLEAEGYRLLERNFHCRSGELDLVAEEGDTLVFVEVKSRSSTFFGLPCESIGAGKRRKLLRAAAYYALRQNWSGRPQRFDVIEVLRWEGTLYLRHTKNVFGEGGR